MIGIKRIERGKGSDLLKKHGREAGVPVNMVRELVKMAVKHLGRARRHGLHADIDEILSTAVEEPHDAP
jgi:hypothetical protein